MGRINVTSSTCVHEFSRFFWRFCRTFGKIFTSTKVKLSAHKCQMFLIVSYKCYMYLSNKLSPLSFCAFQIFVNRPFCWGDNSNEKSILRNQCLNQQLEKQWWILCIIRLNHSFKRFFDYLKKMSVSAHWTHTQMTVRCQLSQLFVENVSGWSSDTNTKGKQAICSASWVFSHVSVVKEVFALSRLPKVWPSWPLLKYL